MSLAIVNKQQVELVEGGLVAEASSLGFGPGEWPDFVGVVDERNEGFMFGPGSPFEHNGELGGYKYQSRTGNALLTVFND